MPYKDPEKQKAAQARWYNEHKDVYKETNRQRTLRLRKWLNEYKTGNPCVDCQCVYPPPVMEFDHLPGTLKVNKVGWVAMFSSVEALEAEIAKCELVCANCHRMRTATRAGWS